MPNEGNPNRPQKRSARLFGTGHMQADMDKLRVHAASHATAKSIETPAPRDNVKEAVEILQWSKKQLILPTRITERFNQLEQELATPEGSHGKKLEEITRELHSLQEEMLELDSLVVPSQPNNERTPSEWRAVLRSTIEDAEKGGDVV